MNKLTKDGLTGNSGFNVEGLSHLFVHVSAPYASTKGRVFVSDGADGWKRVTRAAAKKTKAEVIKCSYCNRAATTLDHLYPYHNEATHCAWHRNWTKLAEEGDE